MRVVTDPLNPEEFDPTSFETLREQVEAPLLNPEEVFDEYMREELSLWQERFDAGDTESSFSWDRFHHLKRAELKRAEIEHAQRLRVVKRQYPEDAPTEFSHDGLQGEKETAVLPMVSHAPLQEPASTAPLKPQVVAPTLESLCKGADDEHRREYAAKIDDMWFNIKNQSLESNHRTACVAVYKLAEWLGIVHKGVKSSEWTATLLERYSISVSEALSKYKIDKPPVSRVFREAVVISFAFAQGKVAILAKNNPLPAIYRNIPAATSKYRK